MATRYYLSNSVASATGLVTQDAGWVAPSNWKNDSKKMATAKSNSALTGEASQDNGTGTSCTNATTGRWLMRQWVSDPIGVFNFNGTTISAVIKCLISGTGTAKLNLSVRLRHVDGTFTTLLAATAADYDTAIPVTTAATRIANAVALANVTSQNNDRLVVEVGVNWSAIVAGCRTITLTDGDPSATADYALTTALTTSLDPWVEFSGTLPAPATYNAAGQFFQFFH